MLTVAVDSETWPIQHGLIAPPLVCVTYALRDERGAIEMGLFDRTDGLAFYHEILERVAVGDAILVFQNAPFDLAVAAHADPSLVPLIFAAYARGAIRDVKERQKLIDLADGRMKFLRDPDTGEFQKAAYTLEAMARRLLHVQLEKGDDSWQLRFRELDGVPIALYPDPARRYAVRDASVTLGIYEVQQGQVNGSPVVQVWMDGIAHVTNEVEQLRAGWALHLTSAWGLRTDPGHVAALKTESQKKIGELRDGRYEELADGTRIYVPMFDEHGTRRWSIAELEDAEGRSRDPKKRERIYKSHTYQRGQFAGETHVSRDMAEIKRRVVAGFTRRGRDCPRTPTGDVATDGDTLLDAGDPVLTVLSEIGEYAYVLSNYLPWLERGTVWPLNPRFNTLLETGRASCANPNIQNVPRVGKIRPCIRARDGWLLCSVDYEQLELCTLGQVMIWLFGRSTIADAINAGKSLHLLFASVDLDITYEEAEKLYHEAKESKIHHIILDSRQNAKGPNYGLPGGMGPAGLVAYMQSQMTREEWMRLWGHLEPEQQLERARRLIAIYHRTYPDMQRFFDWVANTIGPSGQGTVVQPVSGRLRGGAFFCQFCNSTFQGLAADGAKEALWRVTRECIEGGFYATDGSYRVPPVFETTEENALRLIHAGQLSPLYGCHVVNFVHDENIVEMPEHRAHEGAMRLNQVMIETMKAYVPDVAIRAKPALMRFWYKDATDVYDANGRLVAWEPKEEERKAAPVQRDGAVEFKDVLPQRALERA